jgi:hypothetical protein
VVDGLNGLMYGLTTEDGRGWAVLAVFPGRVIVSRLAAISSATRIAVIALKKNNNCNLSIQCTHGTFLR